MMLCHLEGDAVLIEQGEAVFLLRQQGQTILNSVPFQNSSYLKQILESMKLPYQIQAMSYW
jgi:nucleosome binding factor SPN SPT16 subunit